MAFVLRFHSFVVAGLIGPDGEIYWFQEFAEQILHTAFPWTTRCVYDVVRRTAVARRANIFHLQHKKLLTDTEFLYELSRSSDPLVIALRGCIYSSRTYVRVETQRPPILWILPDQTEMPPFIPENRIMEYMTDYTLPVPWFVWFACYRAHVLETLY